MSAERIKSPETERNAGDLEHSAEHHERLRENREKAGEKSPERVDDTLKEALERANSIETEKQPTEQETSPVERRAAGPNKREQEASFKTTMNEVRTHMAAPSRAFSTLIHNKAVERASEAAGKTIARPNAILSGAAFAFILTLGVYLLAKNLGYPLSGFETMGAFALGWIIGLIYDFLKVMITGRK